MANPNTSEKSNSLNREENLTKGALSAKRVAIYSYDATTDTLVPGVLPATTQQLTKDSFGSMIMGSRYNQVEIDYSTTAPASITDITVTAVNGGTSSNASGQALFSSGTNTNGGIRAVTNLSINYRPHAESYVAFSAIFTTGIASSYQRIGLYDTNNGFFIGYEGTSFGVTRRSGGVDTRVAQASFSVDTLTGSASSKYTRNGIPEAADFTRDNLYRIRFGWLGAAPITWEILSPDGEWVVFHQLKHPNTGTVPSIQNPNLPITLDILKTTAGATDLRMNTACWAAGSTSTLGKVSDAITDNTLATLNRSVITGRTTAGGTSYVNVKVTPSGSLTTAIGDITGVVGQKTMANSLPVAIASDQSTVNINDVTPDLTAAISISALSGTSGAITSLVGQSTYVFQLSGTWTGTLQVQITADGTNWLNVTDSNAINSHTLGTFLASGNITANGIYQIDITGLSGVRLIATAFTSGPITGTARATKSDALIAVEGITPVSQSGTWTVQPGNTANTTAWLTTDQRYSTSTLSNVASSATSVQLLAATATRRAAYFFNDSTSECFVKLGTTASTTSFTIKMAPNSYYELPVPVYSGRVDAIWTTANGNMRITELT